MLIYGSSSAVHARTWSPGISKTLELTAHRHRHHHRDHAAHALLPTGLQYMYALSPIVIVSEWTYHHHTAARVIFHANELVRHGAAADHDRGTCSHVFEATLPDGLSRPQSFVEHLHVGHGHASEHGFELEDDELAHAPSIQ